MAMAAKITIVEVEEMTCRSPRAENVVTPAIFVHRIVHAKEFAMRIKPATPLENEMAARAAKELRTAHT